MAAIQAVTLVRIESINTFATQCLSVVLLLFVVRVATSQDTSVLVLETLKQVFGLLGSIDKCLSLLIDLSLLAVCLLALHLEHRLLPAFQVLEALLKQHILPTYHLLLLFERLLDL